VLTYYIEAQGKRVDHEVNDRVMAIGLDVVSAIPNVVLAAGGQHKISAIRAALNAFETNVLITDSDTAQELTASG
jgi:DNA-binding transcriptional regulator LsrR (DeoR family)